MPESQAHINAPQTEPPPPEHSPAASAPNDIATDAYAFPTPGSAQTPENQTAPATPPDAYAFPPPDAEIDIAASVSHSDIAPPVAPSYDFAASAPPASAQETWHTVQPAGMSGSLGESEHVVETTDFYTRSSDEFSRLRNEFRSVRMSTVIPLSAWLNDRPWDLLWVRWFLVYALTPLILSRFAVESSSLGSTAWAFGIYFALLWLAVLHVAMRPGKLDTRLLLIIAAFTSVVGVVLVLLLQQLPGFKQLYTDALEASYLVYRLIGFIFGIGLLEEVVKWLPLLILVYREHKHYSPQMFAFAGVVSGLAFGVAESVSYSYLYARGVQLGAFGWGGYLIVQFVRLISLPLLHATWSAVAGYFMGLAVLSHRTRRALMILGVLIAAGLHGLYDAFSNSWLGLLIAALSILVFISYVRTADIITQELLAQHSPITPEGEIVFHPNQ